MARIGSSILMHHRSYDVDELMTWSCKVNKRLAERYEVHRIALGMTKRECTEAYFFWVVDRYKDTDYGTIDDFSK